MGTHQKSFNCTKSDCLLGNADYIDSLQRCCEVTSRDLGRRLFVAGLGSNSNFNNQLRIGQTIDLIDINLHGFSISIEWFDNESSYVACDRLKAYLLNNVVTRDQSDRFHLLSGLEILLNVANSTEDGETIRGCLQFMTQNNVKVSDCLLDSLMETSIDIFFETGAQLYLDHGVCATTHLPKVIQILTSYEVQMFSNESFNPWASKATRILKTIIDHGADLMQPLPFQNRNLLPLHRVARLAASSPEAALLILKNSPVEAMFKEGSSTRHRGVVFTPASISLYTSIVLLRSNHFGGIQAVLTAVLPLLRSGGIFKPNILKFPDVILSIAPISSDNLKLAFLRLCVESQENPTKDSSQVCQLAGNQENSSISKTLLLVNNMLPLSLQSCCRSAILKRLPIESGGRGLVIRRNLSTLLPRLLRDFLNYNEIEILFSNELKLC